MIVVIKKSTSYVRTHTFYYKNSWGRQVFLKIFGESIENNKWGRWMLIIKYSFLDKNIKRLSSVFYNLKDTYIIKQVEYSWNVTH